ncbi:MAG: argS, partial [Brevibacillus sp.]|nr:argS [Brevibacillus sp.]
DESNSKPFIPSEIDGIEKAEHALLRQLANWQDTLFIAYSELSPNIVCNYAFELATLFNNFYASCPILKASDDQKAFRLWLTLRFKETIRDALTVLGLPTPDRM